MRSTASSSGAGCSPIRPPPSCVKRLLHLLRAPRLRMLSQLYHTGRPHPRPLSAPERGAAHQPTCAGRTHPSPARRRLLVGEMSAGGEGIGHSAERQAWAAPAPLVLAGARVLLARGGALDGVELLLRELDGRALHVLLQMLHRRGAWNGQHSR